MEKKDNQLDNYSLKELILYFLKIGTVGFGGSVALARMMQDDLVKKKKWISERRYLRGLALSQLAPGPLSTQLAIYIGYRKGKVKGATLAGIFFMLPSFLIVLLISYFYSFSKNLDWMQAVLYGFGASIIGIVASSTINLSRPIVKKRFSWLIVLAMFILTVITKQENVFYFLLAGTAATLIYAPFGKFSLKKLQMVIPGISLFSYNNVNHIKTLLLVALFFLQAGTLAFGGGYAILPLLETGAVNHFHWITNKEFLDAVAVAMITPGPTVIAATFIGYLTAGFFGALVATVAILLPIYLIVVMLSPFFDRHSENPRLAAFVEGVTAAAIGAIAGSVLLLGKDSIVDQVTIVIAAVSFILTQRFKVPEIITVLLSGFAGLIFYHSRFLL